MRRGILLLKLWWLAPPDLDSIGSDASKRTIVRGLKVYVALAILILFLDWGAPAVYSAWLAIALAHGFFQYHYAFASTLSRPVQYEEITAVLLALDIINHVAVAGFSRVGWWALAPVGFAWLSLGRIVGTLALNREMKQALAWIREECPAEPAERLAEMTQQLIEERLEMSCE